MYTIILYIKEILTSGFHILEKIYNGPPLDETRKKMLLKET